MNQEMEKRRAIGGICVKHLLTLEDGEQSSPAPAKSTAAPAAAKKETAAPRAVPGAAGANANKDAGAARGARGGRYPSRGGPRTREDRGPRNTLDAATGEGQETAGGFDGERVGELLFGLRTKGRLAGLAGKD